MSTVFDGSPELARNRPTVACDCAAQLVVLLADRGIEATVSDEPPLVPSPYPDLGLSCPHGVRWYAEPTSEQRARWAQDGVR